MLETLSVAISAWVFFNVLTAPGMVFEFWYKWLEKLNEKAPWMAKPLGFCGTCFAGQTGFWWYLFAYGRTDWEPGAHITFTSQVIFFFLALNAVDRWAKISG